MSDMVALSQERRQIFTDIFEGRIPKRVPIFLIFPVEFAIQYSGRNLFDSQWDMSGLEEIYDKICQDFHSDVVPVHPARPAPLYHILGAKNWVMGSNGFLQHPEVEGLRVEEYDAFIEAPIDCLIEKVLPRLYTNLDTDPENKALVWAKAFKAFFDGVAHEEMVCANLAKKYGFSDVNFLATHCEAPLDFVADMLRGFKGISADIRRYPDKVEAAVNAALPLMIKKGLPPVQSKLNSAFIPLHMAPFMREKDFTQFYWPTFKSLVDTLAENGTSSFLFVEQDWSRFADYLYELPENTRMMFEYGDPKMIKEKLGKKHIISGFYPLTLLKTGTKQQCIDKAKELIDTLAPGGKYIFTFDKMPLTIDSVNVENFQAVLDYVYNNTKY